VVDPGEDFWDPIAISIYDPALTVISCAWPAGTAAIWLAEVVSVLISTATEPSEVLDGVTETTVACG
jgi:hypothetical protein